MSIAEITFMSGSLRRMVTIKALIPNERGFIPSEKRGFSTEKMKTLYLLHGYSGDCSDYIVNTNIASLSTIYNLAVIFPSGENSFYLEDTDKGEDYSKFIGEELVAYTRSLFRLSERKEDTYIAGLSMGGYGAMINGLRYPDTFSKIISLSGAYIELNIADEKKFLPDGISDEKYQNRIFGKPDTLRQCNKDPRYCIELLMEKKKKIPDIYFVCGEQDFLIEPNRKMHRFLEDKGIIHFYEEGEGVHDWVYWNKHLATSLLWLLDSGEKKGQEA